ncbi:hypothetical protein ACJ41O_006123 [Fusarium nematophilum]
MPISHLFGILALSLLWRVDAAIFRRDPSCSILNARPSSLTCSGRGYIESDSGKLGNPSLVASAAECANRCASDPSCSFFNFRPSEGYCQPFSGDLKHREDGTSGSYFSQIGCYQCNTGHTLINQNFEDGDYSKWKLIMDNPDEWFLDIQKLDSGNALRLQEATNDGSVWMEFDDPFHLTPGASYRITFLAKTNNKDIQPFDNLRLKISRDGKTVFEAFPEAPTPYFGDWYQFYSVYKVPQHQGGIGQFSFVVYASGSHLDWYFDGISVQRI